jgi:hypothetical protein
MFLKSYSGTALLFLGFFLILIAIIFAYLALTSFLERQSHGSGLLFADVESFGLATIFFAILGVIIVIISRKMTRNR